jgi:hypothetical protein
VLRWIFFSMMIVGFAAASGTMAQSASYSAQIADACAGIGLNPSEAPYLYCEMSLQASTAGIARQPVASAPIATNSPFQSYQRGDQWTSVLRACAQVGLVPDSPAFSRCAANLDATLDDADRTGSD